MAFDPNLNSARIGYYRRIEDDCPPDSIIHVMKLHVESAAPISNEDIRRYLVENVGISQADRHTDKANACEQAGLLESVPGQPTRRRATEKGRQFYKGHRLAT